MFVNLTTSPEGNKRHPSNPANQSSGRDNLSTTTPLPRMTHSKRRPSGGRLLLLLQQSPLRTNAVIALSPYNFAGILLIIFGYDIHNSRIQRSVISSAVVGLHVFRPSAHCPLQPQPPLPPHPVFSSIMFERATVQFAFDGGLIINHELNDSFEGKTIAFSQHRNFMS